MGTGLTALAQLIACISDCRDMRDLMTRREEAVQRFIELRSQNQACHGPFAAEGDKTFPVYAPWLFASYDRLICGDLGLVPAFFGQSGEERGKPVGANSYSFSVYLTMPMAGYLWTEIWKHHYPALPVPWDNGITEDLLRALGGAHNIQRVSQPDYVAPIRPFPLDYNILSAAFDGGEVPWWVNGIPAPPSRQALQDSLSADTVVLTSDEYTTTATAGDAPVHVGRSASTQTASPPFKAAPQPPPRARVVPQPSLVARPSPPAKRHLRHHQPATAKVVQCKGQ